MNRTSNAYNARMQVKRMNEKYRTQIESALINTCVYSSVEYPDSGEKEHPTVVVEARDTVSSILDTRGTVTALNFASYKYAGGGFLSGSQAQEEALCHESFLYNVLTEQQDFYDYNRTRINKGLYQNRALWTPNVVFERGLAVKKCNVITCAAPNWTAASVNGISPEDNDRYLKERILFVLGIAMEHPTYTLILGAYGCGVFGQSPTRVATLFHEGILQMGDCGIRNIRFAIPDFDDNYRAFKDINNSYRAFAN